MVLDDLDHPGTANSWYSITPEEVTARLGVNVSTGLSSQQAADLLERHGPNALPVEHTVPGWRRFLEQYRSYMQIILVAAAIVSLAIKEWSTGVLLILITVLNAVVGLRQEGKAESAMNALKAMVKATARIRRDGTEAEIPAEDVVVGDVVVLEAGDDVPADGRMVQATSLQIDEAALTGERRPKPSPISKRTSAPWSVNAASCSAGVCAKLGSLASMACGSPTHSCRPCRRWRKSRRSGGVRSE